MYVVKALSFKAGAHNWVRKNRALEVRHPILFPVIGSTGILRR
jgi:hypothetical protein